MIRVIDTSKTIKENFEENYSRKKIIRIKQFFFNFLFNQNKQKFVKRKVEDFYNIENTKLQKVQQLFLLFLIENSVVFLQV